MHFSGVKLSGALEEFPITSQFLGSKNAKNQLFEEKKPFECIFHRIELWMITNLSGRLEKHQTLDILLVADFYDFFKKKQIFRYFWYFR